jgi:anti-sigma factor RsiW
MTPSGGAATSQQDPTLLVHAYVDGELDLANALTVKQRIDADPALAAELANTSALQKILRERFPREPVPENLRKRIDAKLGLTPRWASRPTWQALAASVLLAVAISSASTWFAVRGPMGDAGTPLVEEVVLGSHLRALMASKPTEVSSSERHTVKPWFNGRIAEAPRVIDLASEGFPLVGARIDVIGTKPVPALVYSRRLHVISLSAVQTADAATEPALRRSINGYNLVSWNDRGVTYWAASDLNPAELITFAKLFRAAPG